MNQTTHYQLNQWEADDQVRRTDFNGNNAKIDAAIQAVDAKADTKATAVALSALAQTVAEKADASTLAALQTVVNAKGNCRVKFGTYTGTGSTQASLSLDIQPKLVIVAGGYYHALFVAGHDEASGLGWTHVYPLRVTWTAGGLTWSHASASGSPVDLMNAEGKEYLYCALY